MDNRTGDSITIEREAGDGDCSCGREAETFADMTKSRTLGFHGFRDTRRTFLGLFHRLRSERIIP